MSSAPETVLRHACGVDEATTATPQRRLPRQAREQAILEEAVRFFAEVGFEGQTRLLAERLGVTQPLLYRYFPDKETLIGRVFEEAFVACWNPAWDTLLADRSLPLNHRLLTVYRGYLRSRLGYERVRLFLFASLKEHDIGQRYLALIHDRLLAPLVRELRVECGLPPRDQPDPEEIELAAGLHGAVGFLALRLWLYQTPGVDSLDPTLTHMIDAFVTGARITLSGRT